MKLLCILVGVLSVALSAWGHGQSEGVSTSTPKCESVDPAVKVDMTCLEKQLKGAGLEGWVHASVDDSFLFVFTWRRPGNFFVNVQLPMMSKDPEVFASILKLRRHDRIRINGEFFKNEAPLKHINVSSLTVVKPYDGPQESFKYDPALEEDILQGSTLTGKVHIVANGGAVLVVEVGDRVIPVFNDKPSLVANLFRNDKIKIHYKVRLLPQRPSHLQLDTSMAHPVEVIEEIVEGHDKPLTLSGPLVMFPKSPQIKFDVFAIRTEDGDGVNRNFTVVNFDDIDLFLELRERFQKVWDENQDTAQYDRNKYINRNIMVTVSGTKNVVSPDQANPQIVPAKMQDIQIVVK